MGDWVWVCVLAQVLLTLVAQLLALVVKRVKKNLQHCDWCGAGSLKMPKCGNCRLVYYCSDDCQKAAWTQHKVVCVPKRNMDDVMGLTEPVAATAAGQQEQPAPSPNTPLLEMGLSEDQVLTCSVCCTGALSSFGQQLLRLGHGIEARSAQTDTE